MNGRDNFIGRPLTMKAGWLSAVALFLCVAAAHAATAVLPQLAPIPSAQPFSFAVFGDNRAGDDGVQPEVFRQILREIKDAAPNFVVNTGDMIYGGTEDEAKVREYWRVYHQTIAPFQLPIFHVPGNHDIWDPASARLYRELCGPPHYLFDYGRARFIVLDTETLTDTIGPEQFEWLERQLEEAGERIVFVFLHQPLFPVNGAVGGSLDRNPEDRDQLHRLFVKHRGKIKGVFHGHEHLYHFAERDGVPYYITGGAGSNLYVPPEIGGFHHWLLVQVETNNVAVTLKKVGATNAPLQAPRRIAPGVVLESWENGLFWYPWDYTVKAEITPDRASAGQRGLRLNFDLAQNGWPVLSLPFHSVWDSRDAESITVDVYVPNDLKSELSLTTAVEATGQREAAPVKLAPGWNTVKTSLQGAWLPDGDRSSVKSVGWTLTSPDSALRSFVVFDNFRAERRPGAGQESRDLAESWERPLLWRSVDESVRAELRSEWVTDNKQAVHLRVDFSTCERPMLLARLNPPWDLSAVPNLLIDVYVPDKGAEGLSVNLGLRARELQYLAPSTPLKAGWNHVNVPLNGPWLPKEVRASAEQVEWILTSPNKKLSTAVVFDNFRAGGSPSPP